MRVASALLWLNHLQKGSNTKKLQCCFDSFGYFLHTRVVQGHSGRDKVDPSLQTMSKSRAIRLIITLVLPMIPIPSLDQL